MAVLTRKIPKLLTLNTIKERKNTWLWHPYIPTAAASIIFGFGGVGKSHVTCDFAARVSTGTPFPGQDIAAPASNVLMLSAEDEYDSVLVPRLRVAGADLSRIAVPEKIFTLDTAGLKLLEGFIWDFDPLLVIIDPVVAYLGGKVDMNKANEVRPFIGEVHQIAIRTKKAIHLVAHSRKGSEGNDWEKIMGSADFSNGVRSVLYASDNGNGGKILKHAKTNYAKLGPSWNYSWSDDENHPVIEWSAVEEEQDIIVTSDGKNVSFKSSSRLNLAREFLKIVLADGKVAQKQLEKLAAENDISKSTLQRAKAGLARSVAKHVGDKFIWYWELEPHDKPNLSRLAKGRSAAAPVERGDDGREVDAAKGTVDPVSVQGLASVGPSLLTREQRIAAILRNEGLV